MKKSWLLIVIILSLLLAACGGSNGSSEQPQTAPAGGEEPAAAPAEPQPTPTPEIVDVPIYEGAENYKTTGDGTYISYVVPEITVEVVGKFYQEQLAAAGWEETGAKDTSFAGSLSMTRSKPDKVITVMIDANVVNNGVRVLITTIPK